MYMQTKDIQKIRKELNDKEAILRCAEEFSMVGEISEIIGVSISAVSHTLKKLQKAGMVENRREFRTVYYKLKQTPIADMLKEWLTT